MKMSTLAAAFAVVAGLAAAPAATAQTTVNLELALLVDVSGSVNATEFNLQRQGYVDAFNNAGIQSALSSSGRSLAVTLIYWSSGNQQAVGVDWTLVNSAASASSFAAAIAGAARPFSGDTAPGSAIAFAAPRFFNNAFVSDRQIIDVSGDGAQNSGSATAAARTAALALGIDQINGLPILGEAGLLNFYVNNIQGGAGSFTQPANSFDDFGDAVAIKIGREITGVVPEPETYAMMMLGLAGLGVVARRRKAKQ